MNEAIQTPCRWGFLSTALIGKKNWLAVKNSGNGVVAGVASRSRDKAEAFIQDCQSSAAFDVLPEAFESYEAMLESDLIDAVYIPLPTGLRRHWVVEAAKAGKHVLCEKPCARNIVELEAMVAACKENQVQFMDGIMYVHSQRMSELRRAIDGLGKLKRIAMQFSFCADDAFHAGNIRTNSELEPQGCLGDLGWYTIRFALWVMNYQMPKRVTSRMINQFQRDDSPEPVPMEVETRLEFEDDVTATFYNSFLTGHQQWAHISGTEGHAMVKDFVLPYAGDELNLFMAKPEFTVEGCDFAMTENRQDIAGKENGHGTATSQEANLFRNFASIVQAGNVDEHWPDVSLKTQAILDACMKSARTETTIEF